MDAHEVAYTGPPGPLQGPAKCHLLGDVPRSSSSSTRIPLLALSQSDDLH
jgi:hypothetical protein